MSNAMPKSSNILNEVLDLINDDEQPSNTFYINPQTNQVTGMCDGITAIEQSIEYTLGTSRYTYFPFTSYYGVDLRNIVGQNEDYIVSETLARVKDAFLDDVRILNIELNSEIPFEKKDDYIIIYIDITTVYGVVKKGVSLND